MYTINFINKKTEEKYEIINIHCADNFMKKLLGLMGQKNFNGLIFKQKSKSRYFSSVHTSFMITGIDILYINDKNEIQELITLKPWKLYIPRKGYIKYIIELPENSIKKYHLETGVKVGIINEKKTKRQA